RTLRKPRNFVRPAALPAPVLAAHAEAAVLADAPCLGTCEPQTLTVHLHAMTTWCLTGNNSRMKICPRLGAPAPPWSRHSKRGSQSVWRLAYGYVEASGYGPDLTAYSLPRNHQPL